MRISFRGDYALKLMLELAVAYANSSGLQQTGQVAEKLDIPKKFLEQIVLTLKSANYLVTTRGPKGGIKLAIPPSRITLGAIIRLIDGSIAPIACVSCSSYKKCDFEDRCVFMPIWRNVRDGISEVVDKTTFQHLLDRTAEMENAMTSNYSI